MGAFGKLFKKDRDPHSSFPPPVPPADFRPETREPPPRRNTGGGERDLREYREEARGSREDLSSRRQHDGAAVLRRHRELPLAPPQRKRSESLDGIGQRMKDVRLSVAGPATSPRRVPLPTPPTSPTRPRPLSQSNPPGPSPVRHMRPTMLQKSYSASSAVGSIYPRQGHNSYQHPEYNMATRPYQPPQPLPAPPIPPRTRPPVHPSATGPWKTSPTASNYSHATDTSTSSYASTSSTARSIYPQALPDLPRSTYPPAPAGPDPFSRNIAQPIEHPPALTPGSVSSPTFPGSFPADEDDASIEIVLAEPVAKVVVPHSTDYPDLHRPLPPPRPRLPPPPQPAPAYAPMRPVSQTPPRHPGSVPLRQSLSAPSRPVSSIVSSYRPVSSTSQYYQHYAAPPHHQYPPSSFPDYPPPAPSPPRDPRLLASYPNSYPRPPPPRSHPSSSSSSRTPSPTKPRHSVSYREPVVVDLCDSDDESSYPVTPPTPFPLPASPKSIVAPNQCKGTTALGKRCTRIVVDGPPSPSSKAQGASSIGTMDTLDEILRLAQEEGEGDVESLPRFCFQHTKQAMSERGCFVGAKGVYVEFDGEFRPCLSLDCTDVLFPLDWIHDDLPAVTKVLLRHEMARPVSDKDGEGYVDLLPPRVKLC